MTPSDLYGLQLEIECKRVLPSGRLGRVPCENPDDLPLISGVRFLDGSGESVRLREDADDELEELVDGLSLDDLIGMSRPGHPGPLRLRRTFAGRTGVFVRAPGPDGFPLAEEDGDAWVVRVDEEIVSWAVSSRENDRAAELGCETLPAFRRRGYARQVCAAWARDVLASGRVGFYSYDFDNPASAALAASLGVAPQFDAGGFYLAEGPHGT